MSMPSRGKFLEVKNLGACRFDGVYDTLDNLSNFYIFKSLSLLLSTDCTRVQMAESFFLKTFYFRKSRFVQCSKAFARFALAFILVIDYCKCSAVPVPCFSDPTQSVCADVDTFFDSKTIDQDLETICTSNSRASGCR